MPELLFRYRSLRGDAQKYVEKSIVASEIFFAAPDDLNDPYDCQIALDTSGTDLEWRTYLKNSMKQAALRAGRRISFMELHKNATQLIRNKKHQGIDGAEFRKITSSFGLACFSGLLDNQLMWSHYADNHRGVCLMYMPDRDLSGLLGAHHEVRYSNEYPKIRMVDLQKIRPSIVESLLLTKSKDWRYECEYRLIKPYGARSSFTYHPDALAAIILGARISKADEEKVVTWARAHPNRLLVHRAELHLGRFGVQIDTKRSFW